MYVFVGVCPLLCPPTVGKGAISVRPSVCLSVAYIANYSRTHRLACPNLERRFPTFDATGTPVSKSNGQRSGLEAGSGTVFGGNRRPHRLFDEGLEVYFYCILTVVVIEESGAFLRSGFLLGLLGHLKMFLLAFAPIIRVFNSRHPVRTHKLYIWSMMPCAYNDRVRRDAFQGVVTPASCIVTLYIRAGSSSHRRLKCMVARKKRSHFLIADVLKCLN